MNELTIKEDILSLSNMKQNEINVVLAQMTSLTNAIVSGRDDIDSMVTSLEKQPWYKRMWNTITGKNKATKEEIALKKDQMSEYTVQAISNLYEMGKINQDMIINLGQKVNDIYYQTTLNSFEQLMIKDSIIKLRTMVCTIAEKLNDKIEKIDNFTMVTKEIEQGKYNNDNPIVAICGVTSNLNNLLLNDSRKIDIIKNDISIYNLFDDAEKTLTEFMNDVTNIPDDKIGMVYLELASMHDNIWASMFSELMESYNMLPKMERMAKKKDVIISDILEKNRMDANAEFSSEDLFSAILDYRIENAVSELTYEASSLAITEQDEYEEDDEDYEENTEYDDEDDDEDDIDIDAFNEYMEEIEDYDYVMASREAVEAGDRNDVIADDEDESIIAIPYGTTQIGEGAFKGMDIETIFIPNTVTMINYNAFENCEYLDDVIIPPSVTAIFADAFRNCEGLSSIDISNVTGVFSNAFSGCYNLNDIVSSEKLVSIDFGAFRGTGLTSISLPSIYQIGAHAFEDCEDLETVEITGPKAEKIENEAFKGCTSLDTVIFSDSIKTIGNSAFEDCSALCDIKLPKNLQKLGDYAFKDSGLESIELNENLTEIGKGVFEGCDYLEEIRVPKKLYSKMSSYHIPSSCRIKLY